MQARMTVRVHTSQCSVLRGRESFSLSATRRNRRKPIDALDGNAREMSAASRTSLIRKLQFYYRKSKFRRPRGRPPATVADRRGSVARPERSGNPQGGRAPAWVVLALLLPLSPLSLCRPLEGRSRPELSALEAVDRRSDGVTGEAGRSVSGESEGGASDLGWESTNRAVNSSAFSKFSGAEGRRQRRRARERTKRKPLLVTDDVQNYLMTFGYLPQSDRETGLLRTDDQLRSAIRNLQSYANIPATGELDNATLALLKKPRCGLPDFPFPSRRKKRYTLHGQKWMYTNLTWSLRTLNPQNLDGGRVRGVLYHALDVWAKHSKLTFREMNSDRADILVYFHTGYHGDGYAFDGRGQVLAHAFFPGKERGGDAHFDQDEIWILDPYADLEQIEGTSLFAVAAHEFGHSLGLSHSSVQGALMFPWYQGYEGLTPDLQLPDDDRHAIQQLYGPKDTKLWAKIPNYGPYQPEQPRPEPPPRPRPPPTTTTPRPPPPRPTAPPPRPTAPPPRPHPPYIPPRIPEKTPGKPDTCNTTYDAISVIRNEVFIFKDRYLWRIGDQGLRREYPAEISRLWYGLPRDFSKVDAVYERNDKKIVFFIGKMYYVFDANYLMPGYPKPIHYLGLPRELDHIDAAMVWGHNGKTYFFSGTMYWKFDEEVGRVELDYPRDMSMWRGVGYNIDAVFQWKDGKTYFFKGKGFWKFNDKRMRVENEDQKLSAPFWMGCPRTTETDDPGPTRPTTKAKIIVSAASMISNPHCLFIVIVATIYSIIA